MRNLHKGNKMRKFGDPLKGVAHQENYLHVGARFNKENFAAARESTATKISSADIAFVVTEIFKDFDNILSRTQDLGEYTRTDIHRYGAGWDILRSSEFIHIQQKLEAIATSGGNMNSADSIILGNLIQSIENLSAKHETPAANIYNLLKNEFETLRAELTKLGMFLGEHATHKLDIAAPSPATALEEAAGKPEIKPTQRAAGQ